MGTVSWFREDEPLSRFMSQVAPRTRRARRVTGVIGVGMFAALMTVSAPPARAEVTADHADCRDSENPIQAAKALLDGVYKFGQWPARYLGMNLTWTENPHKDDNWQSIQHGLRWTTNLMQAELIEHSGDYETRLFQILRDWEADNPRPGAKSK